MCGKRNLSCLGRLPLRPKNIYVAKCCYAHCNARRIENIDKLNNMVEICVEKWYNTFT